MLLSNRSPRTRRCPAPSSGLALALICAAWLLALPVSAQQTESSELTAEQLREVQRQEARRLRELSAQPRFRLAGPRPSRSVCGNGDFETGLDAGEWEGGYGTIGQQGQPNEGDPIFGSFTPGLFPGALTSNGTHQTHVTAGNDPTVAVSQLAPVGLGGPPSLSAGAVRIGNSMSLYGSELLSKTFAVPPDHAIIPFWYAVVQQNPSGHTAQQQPSFWVRVLDANGQEIAGAVDLGNGAAKAVADSTNPFYQSAGNGVVYRDWSCAEIDLSGHVGETVTVQFVSEDCARGAHYGYAYVDNFCGTCTGDASGSVSLAATCGGSVCVDYTLPVSASGTTGSAQIELQVSQGGTVVQSFASPTLSGGTQHCFDLDPGVFTSAAAYDLVATGHFAIGGATLAPKSDRDEGYQLVCDPCQQPEASRCCRFGACCVGSACVQIAPEECGKLGGTYFGDLSSCQVGACCTADACVRIPRSECDKLNGSYQGDQTTCSPAVCRSIGVGPGPGHGHDTTSPR